jgi:hypothetical protein
MFIKAEKKIKIVLGTKFKKPILIEEIKIVEGEF